MLLSKHPNNVSQGLIAIGYWCDWNDNYAMDLLPDPRRYVDATWEHAERDGVVLYLQRAQEAHRWRGMSLCRFCRKYNGSACQADDKYVWPEGFAHYIEAHSVRPPQIFINHVINQTKPVAFTDTKGI